MVTEDIAEKMNVCATDFPSEMNEVELAGFITAPSQAINVPRLAEVHAALECREYATIEIGRSRIILGRVMEESASIAQRRSSSRTTEARNWDSPNCILSGRPYVPSVQHPFWLQPAIEAVSTLFAARTGSDFQSESGRTPPLPESDHAYIREFTGRHTYVTLGLNCLSRQGAL